MSWFLSYECDCESCGIKRAGRRVLCCTVHSLFVAVLSSQESTLTTLYKIVQTDGFFGLYKGVEAQLLRTVLSAGLMLMAKEKLEHWTRVVLVMIINKISGKQIVVKAKKGKGKH